MENVLKPLAKSVLIPLGLTAATSAIVAAIQKKVFGSGMTILIISNEEVDDIVKIIKSLEQSSVLVKCVSKTIKNEAKGQKGGFLSMLLGTSGASLFGNLLTSKGVKAIIPGRGVMRAGEDTIRAEKGTIRAGQDY